MIFSSSLCRNNPDATQKLLNAEMRKRAGLLKRHEEEQAEKERRIAEGHKRADEAQRAEEAQWYAEQRRVEKEQRDAMEAHSRGPHGLGWAQQRGGSVELVLEGAEQTRRSKRKRERTGEEEGIPREDGREPRKRTRKELFD